THLTRPHALRYTSPGPHDSYSAATGRFVVRAIRLAVSQRDRCILDLRDRTSRAGTARRGLDAAAFVPDVQQGGLARASCLFGYGHGAGWRWRDVDRHARWRGQ